jgi:hypothetical protein
MIAERYHDLMDGFKEWEAKTRKRELEDGRKRNYRIPRLRTLFAVGLGRPVPVSQAEFSFWCGMGRDMIAAVESGKIKVTAGLAGRIYDLTGAELSWLSGKADEESYDYPSLQAWFPKTMPLRAADIKLAHYFTNNDRSLRDLIAILEPLGRSWFRHSRGKSVKWPANIFNRIVAPHLHDPTDHDPYPPLWQAFAFAPSPHALFVAHKEGMLDDCPSDSPVRKIVDELRNDRQTPDEGKMARLSHSLILTLSLFERGRPWP